MNKFIPEDCWEREVPEENPVPAPIRHLQNPSALAWNSYPTTSRKW